MPKVGKKSFPYTSKGVAQAKKVAKKTGKKVVMKKKMKKTMGFKKVMQGSSLSM